MNMEIDKYYKKAGIYLAAILFMCPVACTDNFDEINTRPDQIITKNLNDNLLGQAFAQSQYIGMYGLNGAWQVSQNLFADLYSQYYGTVVTYFNSDQFNEPSSWSGATWGYFYGSAAPQLFFVENYAANHGMPVENAIAKIWRVQIYHRISDYFGPIIYSQFGNGKTSVAYDSQEAVYKDFFKTLDEACTVLKENPGAMGFPSSDLLYNGRADQWLTFANSLRLRLAMRLAYVDPNLAKQEAEKAVVAGVMMNNSDNAKVLTTEVSRNGMDVINSFGEFRMSATMQSVLTGFDDPRISEYFNEAEIGGGYIGIRNGLPSVEKSLSANYYSNIDTKWQLKSLGGTNPPLRVMCAAEVYFLRAEGALRGWNMDGTANELYNQGISMSISEWTSASRAEIDAYLTSTNKPVAINDKWNTPPMSDIPVAYETAGGFERQLEQIITQKWIAVFPDGWEAWTERRRTGYPRGYPIIESVNPDVPANGMMRRLRFTSEEISNNSVAVEAARKLLDGPDNNSTRVWWDAK